MKKEKWLGLLLAVGLIAMLMAQPADSTSSGDPIVEKIKAIMTEMNLQLESMGENVRIGMVEYYTALEKAGQIVYFDDRTMQMGSHWVPGDPRRGGFWDIAWLSDQVDGTANGPSQADTQAAVDRAMATWDGVNCSYIPLTKLSDSGNDWGYIQWIAGMGGYPGWYADITQAGWLPGAFFDAIAPPDGSTYILGVTYTLVWLDSPGGYPTDIDNNGKMDVAFREIYYNNNFVWSNNPVYPEIDVETVVLHETGHGLSQGHFGKLFKTEANGKFHFAPRLVMNAGYTGVLREIRGTDNGGHCSIWGSWPKGGIYHPGLELPVDIEPGTCPNPLNTSSQAVLPVAILGTEDFDALTIDPAYIKLEGIAPLSWDYKDVATPFEGELCDCHELYGDGYLDLTLEFDAKKVLAVLGPVKDGDVIELTVAGNLKREEGGARFSGQDCVVIQK